MTDWAMQPAERPALAVRGGTAAVPVHRIFCVGRNYAAHAAEMGGEVDREAPWYFLKSAHHFTPSGGRIPCPPGTSNLHHEVELALVIGRPLFRAAPEAAAAAIWGWASALDMTRRDLQQIGKDHRRPWDLGKDFENGAVIAPVTRADAYWPSPERRIALAVNGRTRQDATLGEMVWTPVEIVSHLSGYYHLRPGDVILTGTPAGVGPVVAGDRLEGGVEGLDPVVLEIGDAE